MAPEPRLAYAANRELGLRGLRVLLEAGLKPAVLVLPKGRSADRYVEEMRGLAPPRVLVLEGKEFREAGGLEVLSSLELDYILSVHFPYIIPREVLKIPRVGTLNLHPAYLPFNRGWHTPTWAIQEGTPYGATLHWVDEGIDTGDIALQRELEVGPGDTAHGLYRRVLRLEEELLREAIPLLAEHALPRVPQEPDGTSHVKDDLEALRRLDLSETREAGNVIRLLRALTTNDWGEAAYFEVDGTRYGIRVEIRREDEE